MQRRSLLDVFKETQTTVQIQRIIIQSSATEPRENNFADTRTFPPQTKLKHNYINMLLKLVMLKHKHKQ